MCELPDVREFFGHSAVLSRAMGKVIAKPPTPEVSERMRKVVTKGTEPELRVRSIVRRLGIRYTTRTHVLPGKPDLLLPDHGIAVFVHGCFWHGCPRCFREPKHNKLWWREKIQRNRQRDRRKADHLRRLGYSVLSVWEHDSHERIERRIIAASESTIQTR